MPRSTVFVTGGGGLIGSALVPSLLDLDLDVSVADRDSTRLEQFAAFSNSGRVRTFDVDITNADRIAMAMAVARPAAIVHLAAMHFIPECEAEPRSTVGTNLDGLVNVLDAAGREGTEFVLFASTADVYESSVEPLAEGDLTCSSTVYGATKLLGERLVAEWAEGQVGRRATSLRIFNVYGPADRNPHVIPDILKGIQQGGEIRVGNAEARRDFIHVDDLAELLCRVLTSVDPPTLVNAGTGQTTSVAELLQLLQGLVDRPFVWSSDPAKVRQSDRICLRADTTRLRSSFPGFEPRDIETGLGDVLAALGVPVGGV